MKKLLPLLLALALFLCACGEIPPAASPAPPKEVLPPEETLSPAEPAAPVAPPVPEKPPVSEPAPALPETVPAPEATPLPQDPIPPKEPAVPEEPAEPEKTDSPVVVPGPESGPAPAEPPAPAPVPDPAPTPEPAVPAEPTPPAEEAVPGYHETVPILMYHEVNDLLANDLYLSVADFTAHLDYFQKAGITPISMQQLYDHWNNDTPLPAKPIVLTFDDGYRSMYTTVYPLLKERGWSGTFFCIVNGRWSDNFVLEDMIAEMAAGGMEIGSHTLSHVELNSITGEELRSQLAESREILSAITGKEVNMLCYPAGRYNSETKAVAEEEGYLCSVTTVSGFAAKSQGMFELKRIRVDRGCGAPWLESVLSPLGY